MMTLRTTCPVCGCDDAVVVTDRADVPVHQNQVFVDAAAARAMPRGTLAMRCCERCGFVWNAAFDDTLLRYDEQYDNRQTCSPAFVAHMDAMIDRVLAGGRRTVRVVEIGCGKGAFLRRLVERAGEGCTGVGFDPTYDGPLTASDGRLRFERRFFDAEAARRVRADVIVCRHVIEHIAEPVAFLRSVCEAVGGREDVRLYFETPCARWILTGRVVWDLFYEHCSLFTAQSLHAACDAAGLRVEEVAHVFEGQYLWAQCVGGNDRMMKDKPLAASRDCTITGAHRLDEPSDHDAKPQAASEASPAKFTALTASADLLRLRAPSPQPSPGGRGGRSEPLGASEARGFAAAEREVVGRWRAAVDRFARAGGVAVWGAGAKGVTFVHLVDPDATRIACLVDMNPNKQGRHLAGGGHRIVAPEALVALNVRTALVLNPNYHAEVQRTVDALGLDVRVIDMTRETADPT